MPNVTQLYAALCDAPYRADGIARGLRDFYGWMAEREHLSDALESEPFVVPLNGTGAATVIATQAVRLYAVEIISAGSAGFLTMYNLTAATVGVSAISMVIPFAANQSKFVPIYASGYDAANDFATGLTAGIVTAVASSTAIGTAVTGVKFYTDAAP